MISLYWSVMTCILFSLCSPSCFSKKRLSSLSPGLLTPLSSNPPVECLTLLIQRGQLASAESLYESSFQQGSVADQKKVLYSVQQSLRALEAFQKVISTDRSVSKIEPVFQWGQSKTNILIQVKFAHRFDSPGCLNLNNEQIEIGDNKIHLLAQGIQAHQPIDFQLDLDLYREIDASSSSYRFESVGKMSFNLTKSIPSIWPRLSSQVRKEQIWWEMKSIYESDMKEFAELKEREEDIAVQQERKRRLARQKQQREEQEKRRQSEVSIDAQRAKVLAKEKSIETQQVDAIEKLRKEVAEMERKSREKQESLLRGVEEEL